MAAKPIIFSVDDDAEVLRALERDLRQQYGSEYRIIRAGSGAEALQALRQLKLRNDVVALFIADQRMPEMTGVEFLSEALKIYPDARKVLLTAYADTDAAINAINLIGTDHYLLKPWDPPEDKLFPVLQDLLDGWQATFYPPFEGVQIVGHRWSPRTHAIKDFLAGNQIPYRWLDLETNPEAAQVLALTGLEKPNYPVLVFEDGSVLTDPETTTVAERVGLHTRAESRFYDLAIVGAGPAGLAAGVYGASEGLRTVMIERKAPGGQAGTSSRIENYLGFPVGLSGADLARRGVTQALRLGAEILTPQEVLGIRNEGPYRILSLGDGSEISCHALLIACGVSYNVLDVPNADRLSGAGVYYGATLTEAMLYEGQDVMLVGAGNSAGQAAMHFARYANRVIMLVRGSSLSASMSQYLIDQIEATPCIEVWYRKEVVEVHGSVHLEAVTYIDKGTEERESFRTNALFIFIGAQPQTEWIGDAIARDSYGYVLTGPDIYVDGRLPAKWPVPRAPFLLESSVPGVFVAGDARHGSVKRVASAVGEGSIAIQFIHRYLATL